ncbi:MAG: flagellar hook-length control protein FliK, partial [Planctomycetes bacterium]|nr:flagellar hook-length control protein FliK [Planctomycetota bacterium]
MSEQLETTSLVGLAVKKGVSVRGDAADGSVRSDVRASVRHDEFDGFLKAFLGNESSGSDKRTPERRDGAGQSAQAAATVPCSGKLKEQANGISLWSQSGSGIEEKASKNKDEDSGHAKAASRLSPREKQALRRVLKKVVPTEFLPPEFAFPDQVSLDLLVSPAESPVDLPDGEGMRGSASNELLPDPDVAAAAEEAAKIIWHILYPGPGGGAEGERDAINSDAAFSKLVQAVRTLNQPMWGEGDDGLDGLGAADLDAEAIQKALETANASAEMNNEAVLAALDGLLDGMPRYALEQALAKTAVELGLAADGESVNQFLELAEALEIEIVALESGLSVSAAGGAELLAELERIIARSARSLDELTNNASESRSKQLPGAFMESLETRTGEIEADNAANTRFIGTNTGNDLTGTSESITEADVLEAAPSQFGQKKEGDTVYFQPEGRVEALEAKPSTGRSAEVPLAASESAAAAEIPEAAPSQFRRMEEGDTVYVQPEGQVKAFEVKPSTGRSAEMPLAASESAAAAEIPEAVPSQFRRMEEGDTVYVQPEGRVEAFEAKPSIERSAGIPLTASESAAAMEIPETAFSEAERMIAGETVQARVESPADADVRNIDGEATRAVMSSQAERKKHTVPAVENADFENIRREINGLLQRFLEENVEENLAAWPITLDDSLEPQAAEKLLQAFAGWLLDGDNSDEIKELAKDWRALTQTLISLSDEADPKSGESAKNENQNNFSAFLANVEDLLHLTKDSNSMKSGEAGAEVEPVKTEPGRGDYSRVEFDEANRDAGHHENRAPTMVENQNTSHPAANQGILKAQGDSTTASTILDRLENIERLSDAMKMANRNGVKNLTLTLSPPELGKVMLRVESRNGLVSAFLRVEKPEAVSQLMSGLAQLRERLKTQGIELGELDIRQQQSQEAGDWDGRRGRNREADTDAET